MKIPFLLILLLGGCILNLKAQGLAVTDWSTATSNPTETQYTQNVTVPGCTQPVVVKLTLSGSGVDNISTGNSGSVGTGTSNRLNTNVRFDNPNETLVWTVSFSVPVTNVNFTIWNVDRQDKAIIQAAFQDVVMFSGSPTITPASNSSAVHTISGTTITGIDNITSSNLNNSPKIDYGAPAITGFSFTWSNGPDVSRPNFLPSYISQTIGLGNISMTSGMCPMPVNLVSFKGQTKDKSNVLTWETGWESKNEGFEIHRSLDAKNFSKIGFVAGNNTTDGTSNYDFTDKEVFEGVTYYYLLKQKDFDGTFNLSKIISLKSLAKVNHSGLHVYPNPSNGEFSLQLSDLEKTSVNLYNVLGIEVPFNTIMNEKNELTISPKSLLDPGMYIVQVQQKDGRKDTFRVFVRK